MSGKKETVLDLGKFIDKGVRVKLSGGREVTGVLKGFDQLLNLVLDECVEFLRGEISVLPSPFASSTRRAAISVSQPAQENTPPSSLRWGTFSTRQEKISVKGIMF